MMTQNLRTIVWLLGCMLLLSGTADAQCIFWDDKECPDTLIHQADWCSADEAYCNELATPDGPQASCHYSAPDNNVWFTFQATGPEIQITMKAEQPELFNGLLKPQLALWDDGLNELGCAVFRGDQSTVVVEYDALTIGEWYLISCDNFISDGGSGTFTVCIDNEVSYDYPQAAYEITDLNDWCSTDGQFTTEWANPDGDGGSCWLTAPKYNRWFKFTATASQLVRINLDIGGAKGTMKWPNMTLYDSNFNEVDCENYTASQADLSIINDNLTPGETYYIEVDNYANASRAPNSVGTFTLCVSANIDYDFRNGAYEITDLNQWCSADGAFSTFGASPDQNGGSCWYTGPDFNRWFRFTATADFVTVNLKTGGTEGTMKWPYLALWDDGGSLLDCQEYLGQYTDLTVSSTSLTPGNDYYISVDNYSNNGSTAQTGTFTLCVNSEADYDQKSGAIELTDLVNWCSTDAAYTCIGATGDQSKGSCAYTGPDFNRWFKFTAPSTYIDIDLKTGGSEGTLSFPYLTLWDHLGNELDCQQYTGQYDDISVKSTTLTPGNEYFVSVDCYFNGTQFTNPGSFTLCANAQINTDYLNDATVIATPNSYCSANAQFSTFGGGDEGPKPSCWYDGPNYNRWFRFTATGATHTATLKLGGAFGTMKWPYLAMTDAFVNTVDCQVYISKYGHISVSSNSLTPGQDYYIEVDHYGSPNARGSFSLCMDNTFSKRDELPANESLIAGNIESGISVFPNPFSSAFNVRLPPSLYDTPVTLTLVDLSGRVVAPAQQAGARKDEPIRFDARGLPAGTYLLLIDSDKGRVARRVVQQ